MKKFKQGDNLTLEEVRKALNESRNNNIVESLVDESEAQSHLSADGYYEFDSWEDYKKVFGDFVSVEEVFKSLARK